MANKDLNKAKVAKKDEFYTRLEDIENELKYYRHHFKGKTVLCNCDDPRCSNFFRYFTLNFEVLGLKKVIATCYKNQDVDLFSQHACERAVFQIYEGDKKNNRKVDDEEDDDVTKKSGIVPCVLGEGERCLSIRAFTEAQKLAAYTRQGGVCKMCGKKFNIDEMNADRIKPWSKGGHTTPDNCQMPCSTCNFTKSNK